MANRRKNIIIVKLLIILLTLILVIMTISRILSRYETESSSQADIQVAFYLLENDYQSMSMKLGELEPSNQEYSYTFSVSNNDSQKRTETSLEYDVNIITTTNLPLIYELYMRNDENELIDIVKSEQVTTDDDGTYFRTISTETETFGHQANETNIYTLVIRFPATYRQIQYQNIIESVEIEIKSRQLIEEQ